MSINYSVNLSLWGSLITSIQQTLFVGVIHGAGVRWTPLRSRSTDRAGRRDYDPFQRLQYKSKRAIHESPLQRRRGSLPLREHPDKLKFVKLLKL